MTPIAIFGLIAGVVMVYSAATGQSPITETLKALRGEADGPDEGSTDLPGFVGPEINAQGGAVGTFGPSIGETESTTGGSCAGMPVPTNLVSVGGGHRLESGAAAGLRKAEAIYGGGIRLTDSFRSRAQQADCHKRKPNLCAEPGKSCHEKGRAIDIIEMNVAAIKAALGAAGWVQWAPDTEPWHWSYKVRG